MTFFLVIRDFDNDTRTEGPELARVEPDAVGAALNRLRPGHETLVGKFQAFLDDVPPHAYDPDDPQILMTRQLLKVAEELSVQFSGFDDVAKEEARYAHYDRPEDPIRYSDPID